MSIHLSNLTSKQKKVYTVIENYIKVNSIPPTVREIGELVGEKTPGAVQGILNRLEQKGVIKRQVGMARSIQLVTSDNTMYADPVFVPEIKKITQRNVDDLLSIYNVVKYHPVTPELLNSQKKYFIIHCPDNSMANKGISEGDWLLVAFDEAPEENSVVLALYDGHLLLRSYKNNIENGAIILSGDTSFIEKELFEASEVKIVGKVEGSFSKVRL